MNSTITQAPADITALPPEKQALYNELTDFSPSAQPSELDRLIASALELKRREQARADQQRATLTPADLYQNAYDALKALADNNDTRDQRFDDEFDWAMLADLHGGLRRLVMRLFAGDRLRNPDGSESVFVGWSKP